MVFVHSVLDKKVEQLLGLEKRSVRGLTVIKADEFSIMTLIFQNFLNYLNGGNFLLYMNMIGMKTDLAISHFFKISILKLVKLI